MKTSISPIVLTAILSCLPTGCYTIAPAPAPTFQACGDVASHTTVTFGGDERWYDVFANQSGQLLQVSARHAVGRCDAALRLVATDHFLTPAPGGTLDPANGEAGPFDLSVVGGQRIVVLNKGFKIQAQSRACLSTMEIVSIQPRS